MRDLDVGRFLRLRNAIQGAMDAIDPDSQAMSGIALPEAYKRFRAQAAELVPGRAAGRVQRHLPGVEGASWRVHAFREPG